MTDRTEKVYMDELSEEKVVKDYLFYVRIVQSDRIKSLLEALKEIFTEINIITNKKGISVVNITQDATIVVDMHLEAKKFNYYYCAAPEGKNINIGIDLLKLFNITKNMSNDSVLTIFMNKKKENLGIYINNKKNGERTMYTISLLDLDTKVMNKTEINYNTKLIMSSVIFQKLSRDISAACSDTIGITTFPNEIIFECKGDNYSFSKSFVETKDVVQFYIENSKSKTLDQGYFSTKDFSLFSKCTSLSRECELSHDNQKPLTVRYSVGNLGYMEIILGFKSVNLE